jgi:hypothetical protein
MTVTPAYEGPASRLKPPALLIYAGTRMGDERFVLRGTRLLAKSWKPDEGASLLEVEHHLAHGELGR